MKDLIDGMDKKTEGNGVVEKVAFHFPIPDMTEEGAVMQLSIRDIAMIRTRIETAATAHEAFGYRDALRLDADEIAELLISAASTASLAGYRREGDRWRLECREHSETALAVIAELDALRSALLKKEPSIRRYIISAATTIRMKRSIATCAIALEAVSPRNAKDFRMIAGISRNSGDPQGDAQANAEEWLAAGELPSNV